MSVQQTCQLGEGGDFGAAEATMEQHLKCRRSRASSDPSSVGAAAGRQSFASAHAQAVLWLLVMTQLGRAQVPCFDTLNPVFHMLSSYTTPLLLAKITGSVRPVFYIDQLPPDTARLRFLPS